VEQIETNEYLESLSTELVEEERSIRPDRLHCYQKVDIWLKQIEMGIQSSSCERWPLTTEICGEFERNAYYSDVVKQ
jgi:hypothetical protein